ncbi:MAG: aminotransferase class I/II-fold pyridoxal phosphate-dependent enzyme [Bacteroidetes bacterium]|nr:aminotransferase class I/II-fold pyridoxal phosphate-dependent enzyme [Bacteroidota bacterium]MCH8232796.1 aminotransferase class I/II-fold pyridoxal phosphate-dependent enzyme [Bacteroidota bacterium]
MKADLRSDTFTKPTPDMLSAMMAAEVGDDVFGEDPTVNALEKKAAGMFGMEAAIFCPSGTMTNQIAIRVHTQLQDEVICDHRSHIYQYEGGGIASNSGVSVKLLDGDRGRLKADDIRRNINPDDIHKPVTRLVGIENTVNKGGGCYYDMAELKKIRDVCNRHRLVMHLDGARLFNALVETGEKPSQHGELFDTVSVCLSKGLGAPVGSLLIGSKEMIKKARWVRKVFGGGMRQAGFLAAAGIYALENNIDRLKDDHRRARTIGDALQEAAFVSEVMPIDTNIIIFSLKEGYTTEQILARLADKNVLALPFGPNEIRMITHLDFIDEMLEHTVQVLKTIR